MMNSSLRAGCWIFVLAAVVTVLAGPSSAHAARLRGSARMLSTSIETDAFSTSKGRGTKRRSTPPVIAGTPPTTGEETQLYVFEPTASDANGDPLTFSIANKPSWASFSASTGLLSGIPPLGSAGTYPTIVITVTDGWKSSSLPAFDITVSRAPNQPPTIWGVPATSVDAGQAYAFRPSAADPEGQQLRFSVAGLPSWATLDRTTGELTGTPTATNAGTYAGITISVSDGQASASLAPFSIAVTSSNLPPKISGVPSASATAGQAYSFVPTASDPEGQKLAFSVANKPLWAKFDSTTGRLYGTPTDANAGTYSGIVIAASDGQNSAALPAFAIFVEKPAARSATLSWVPPTSNVDGTPITNLAGYRIAYGQSSSGLNQVVDIPSPGVTSAAIENLAAGTWYFAVKAYTTANVESDLSNIAQKTIL